MGVIVVLHQAYGLGSEQIPAPQGQALATVIQGVLGGDIPIDKYAAGAGLGALLSSSGIGGLGVLVGLGFYLPFNIVLTYSDRHPAAARLGQVHGRSSSPRAPACRSPPG